MNLFEYQKAIEPFKKFREDIALTYLLFGLIGESGEYVEKLLLKVESITREDILEILLEEPNENFNILDSLSTTLLKSSEWELDRENLLYELGDILWYAVAICSLLDFELHGFIYEDKDLSFLRASSTLCKKSSLISNLYKKVLRGDKTLEEATPFLLTSIKEILPSLNTLAIGLGSSLEEIARLNYEKLYSRLERGALLGDGDNR